MQEAGVIGVLNLKDAIHGAMEQLRLLLGLEVSRVVAASKMADGWQVTIEVVERKAVPDTQDLLGTYTVSLDQEGELTEYQRTDIRRRMDLLEAVE